MHKDCAQVMLYLRWRFNFTKSASTQAAIPAVFLIRVSEGILFIIAPCGSNADFQLSTTARPGATILSDIFFASIPLLLLFFWLSMAIILVRLFGGSQSNIDFRGVPIFGILRVAGRGRGRLNRRRRLGKEHGFQKLWEFQKKYLAYTFKL